MKRTTTSSFLRASAHRAATFLLTTTALFSWSTLARAQCATTRGSLDASGAQADLGSGLSVAALDRTYLSADGRYVAFWSSATNLVANDLNGRADVFVRDLVTGVVELVSVDSAGVQGDGDSSDPSISADGDLIAFQSSATNLVAGDTNARVDVYVHRRSTNTTTRVSVDALGVEGNHDSTRAAVSSNGLLVAFQGRASNWIAGDANNQFDAFVKVLATGALDCVSLTTGGIPGDNASGSPAISGDGRWVAFHSRASNLVANDTNGEFDVFLRDRQTGTIERLSVGPLGEEADYFSQTPSITPDGRYVAFSSSATNLIANDTNNVFDVFVRDTALDHTQRISVDSQDYQGTSTSQGNSISADGRFIVFQSSAPNLVLGDTNGGPFDLEFDVFVHDRMLKTTVRLSVDDLGVQGDLGSSMHACVSADGSRVAFFSDATNLVAADTNGARDLFLKGCGAPPGPTPSCAGDGTGAPCPCGNLGSSGRGCENSFLTGGARLEGSGSTTIGNDTLHFLVYGLPPTASALLFQGTEFQNGALGAPFGDGLRCAGGSVQRLGARFASGGSAAFGHGVPGDTAISVAGSVPPGTVSLRAYQIWYRNVASFCTPAGFNLSNGVRVVWTP